MFIVHRIVFALNGIALLLLLISYAAPYVSPELFWPVSFLGLAYPVIVALNLLFAIYWIAFFKLKFLISLVGISLGFNYITLFVQINAKRTTEKEHIIRAMSFNMRYFGAFEGKELEKPERFFSVFDKVNADVICLQESKSIGTKIDDPLFNVFFNKIKSYHTVGLSTNKSTGKKSTDDLLIASRFPIIKADIVERVAESGNYTIYADIVAHGDTIRVVNTHLRSIHFENKEYNVVKNLDSDSLVSGYKSISQKLKAAFIDRAKQAQNIREFLLVSPYPIILCGDFNDSPTSYAYNLLKGRLKDSFVESGSGLGRTYVGTMPSFRIDYILADPKYSIYNYYAKAFEFSDHKMVSCTIKLK